MSSRGNIFLASRQARRLKNKRKVIVATYTNEGLKFQMIVGPLKFEPLRRGRPKVTV